MFQTLKEVDPAPTIARQLHAISNWTGKCNQLPEISNPTLIITGIDDVSIPPANSLNSLIIAQKIPGSWLVQLREGGHGLMYQYPDQFSKIVKTFLAVT